MTPVDDILRVTLHQVSSGKACRLFLGAIRRRCVALREIHQHESCSAHQRFDQHLPEEVREVSASPVAVFDEVVVEGLPALVGSLEAEDRLPAEHRCSKPVDDGP